MQGAHSLQTAQDGARVQVSAFLDTAQGKPAPSRKRQRHSWTGVAGVTPRIPNRLVDAIVDRVAGKYGLRAADVYGVRRTKTIARARRESMQWARIELGLSYPELGRAFGRDHRSVQCAVKGRGR